MCLKGDGGWGLVLVAEVGGSSSVSSMGHELLQLLLLTMPTLHLISSIRCSPHLGLIKAHSNRFFTVICINVVCKKYYVEQKAQESLPSKPVQLSHFFQMPVSQWRREDSVLQPMLRRDLFQVSCRRAGMNKGIFADLGKGKQVRAETFA